MRRIKKTVSRNNSYEDRTSEQDKMYAAVCLFSQNRSLSEIARSLKTSRYHVLKYLQEAFTSRLVKVPSAGPLWMSENLSEIFKGIEFYVIAAQASFDELAARRLLEWIEELCDEVLQDKEQFQEQFNDVEPFKRKLYIAIGGGKAMHGIADATKQLVADPSSSKLRSWFDLHRSQLMLVNATAGGQVVNPQYESSFLTVNLADSLKLKAATYSVSQNSDPWENELLKNAIPNTRIIVSGIGDKAGAYCLRAMYEKRILSKKLFDKTAAELLYHPITSSGELLWEESSMSEGEVKEKQALRESVLIQECSKERSEERKAPMFATLFKLNSLRGRPAPNPAAHFKTENQQRELQRHLIGIVKEDETNLKAKATAVRVLLEKRYFTRVCMTINLAREILSQLQGTELLVSRVRLEESD